MSDAVPTLSVIVCHHTGTLWQGCFETLAQSVGVSFELIVVSSNPPPEWAGEWFTVLHDTGGPAHKRNVGVQHSHGEYLVFLDDDTEVSPYLLYNFWRGFQELPTAGMLFARIYNGERRSELDDCGSWLTPTGFLYARASCRTLDADTLLRPVPCLASKSAGCAIRRDTFLCAGGFDASYYILGEETDLAWRVWLSGAEVWYWPHAVLWHYFNTGAKPVQDYYTLRRIHEYGARNYQRCLFTNVGWMRLLPLLLLQALAWLLAVLGFTLRGQHLRGWCILRGLWDFYTNLPWAKRRAVQSTRRVSDHGLWPLITCHVPWAYYPQRLMRYIFNGLHG